MADVVPMVSYEDCAAAADWLVGAFGFEETDRFEDEGAPVDAYGVGSSLIRGQNDFTADVVLLEGRPCAKAGRRYVPNPRLEKVE